MKPVSATQPAYLRALAAVLLAALPVQVPAATAGDAGTDRIIVKWRDSPAGVPDAAQMRDLAQHLGNPFASGRNLGRRMSVLRLAPSRRDRLPETLAALRADPAVESAAPDRRVRALAYVPDDPFFSATFPYGGATYETQWYLKSAQPAAIRADAAWDITHGDNSPADSPVVVAVVDSGIRPDHPDLAGKLLPGFDFVSDTDMANDGDGWDADPTDPGDFISADDLQKSTFRNRQCGGGTDYDQPLPSTWHGTRVAGLIGAATDNGIGMAGAGFNVRIVPVRVLGKCGGYESDVIAGMYWAAGFFDAGSGRPIPAPLLTDPGALKDHRNLHPAQVINLSLGAAQTCDPYYSVAVQDITAAGVLVVAAAGNDGAAVDEPANCPGALAVAGLRQAGTKVGYSNLGPEIGIAAPAGNCPPTDPQDQNPPCLFALNTLTNLGAQNPGADDYSTPLVQPSYGTSFSSPLAAATAGLMKAANPALTPALLIARIRAAARPFPATDDLGTTQACVLPAANPAQATACVCNTQVCGAGMLDAGGAVQAALRPAVTVSVSRNGRSYLLDGSTSAAAAVDGRAIASYAWSVVDVTGGATVPAISGADQAIASIPVPAQGSVTLQLAVTDNAGASDSARVTATADSASSDSTPPQQRVQHGGGGPDIRLLALLCLLLAARLARRLFPVIPH
ncbi:MAG TPA: S8 family serine peptidase [Steroidobacteraceae bacterium]|nr:S8 family serine peptidase [Steroidobacteraceae bacterium]